MRRVFNTWSLASFFSSTAIAVTMITAVNAGAAIVSTANSDVQPLSATRTGTELLVDWNQDFIVYSNLDTENAERPALSALSPEETQTSDGTCLLYTSPSPRD